MYIPDPGVINQNCELTNWDAIPVSAPSKFASIYTDKGELHRKRKDCYLKKASSSRILNQSHL